VRTVIVTLLVRRVVEAVHRVLPPAVVGVRVQTGRADAVLRRLALCRRVPGEVGLLHPEVAAGQQHLAAVVHVVAQHVRVAHARVGQVRRAGERERAVRHRAAAAVVRVRDALADGLRDEIVAGVEHDRVEVRQHAEVVDQLRAGLAVRAGGRFVDVDRLDRVTGRRERRDVLVEVARSGGVRGLVGRQARVVLGRHHEHPRGLAGGVGGDHAE
jgi:hypothetical protein